MSDILLKTVVLMVLMVLLVAMGLWELVKWIWIQFVEVVDVDE